MIRLLFSFIRIILFGKPKNKWWVLLFEVKTDTYLFTISNKVKSFGLRPKEWKSYSSVYHVHSIGPFNTEVEADKYIEVIK